MIIWENFEFFFQYSLYLPTKDQIFNKKKFGWFLQVETVNTGEGTNPIIHLCE